MEHLTEHSLERADRKSETLKYIAEMVRELAKMADDIGDVALAYDLRRIVTISEAKESMPRH